MTGRKRNMKDVEKNEVGRRRAVEKGRKSGRRKE